MSPLVRRVLIGLGVAIAAYVWFFGFQTAMIVETRWMAWDSPVVGMTPRSLPTTSIASGPGKKLTYFGYEFEVPWDDLDNSRTQVFAHLVVLRFHSGHAITFTSLPPRDFVNSLLKNYNKNEIRQFYGDSALQSDYALLSLVAGTTPGKITLFSSHREAARTATMLAVKASTAPVQSGIFSIQTSNFKGFQWGDPQAHPKGIVADLFSDDGQLEFVSLGPDKGKPPTISQIEINRVLQTVHKVELPETEAQSHVTAVSPPK